MNRPYQMSARAEQAAATADRVLDAVLVEYAAAPFDLMRLDEVAGRAGVTVQTVLRRFGSKAGLVVALARRELGRIAALRAAGLGAPAPVLLRALVEHYETYGDLIAKMYGDADRVEGLAEVARAGRSHHVAWCVEAFAGVLGDAEGELRTRRSAQVVALCDASTWRILRREQGLSPDQVEVALTELLSVVAGPAGLRS
jgi:AcrR family transcriptional regulator